MKEAHLKSSLKKLEDGTATRTPQDDSKSSYAKMLDKKLGDIDFSKGADEIERLIRGLNPWPSAYTRYNGKTLKTLHPRPLVPLHSLAWPTSLLRCLSVLSLLSINSLTIGKTSDSSLRPHQELRTREGGVSRDSSANKTS